MSGVCNYGHVPLRHLGNIVTKIGTTTTHEQVTVNMVNIGLSAMWEDYPRALASGSPPVQANRNPFFLPVNYRRFKLFFCPADAPIPASPSWIYCCRRRMKHISTVGRCFNAVKKPDVH